MLSPRIESTYLPVNNWRIDPDSGNICVAVNEPVTPSKGTVLPGVSVASYTIPATLVYEIRPSTPQVRIGTVAEIRRHDNTIQIKGTGSIPLSLVPNPSELNGQTIFRDTSAHPAKKSYIARFEPPLPHGLKNSIEERDAVGGKVERRLIITPYA